MDTVRMDTGAAQGAGVPTLAQLGAAINGARAALLGEAEEADGDGRIARPLGEAARFIAARRSRGGVTAGDLWAVAHRLGMAQQAAEVRQPFSRTLAVALLRAEVLAAGLIADDDDEDEGAL